MVSDGSQYRVWNSVSNKFFVGDAKAPPTSKSTLLNLRPQHILDALFVDVRPYETNPRVSRFIEEVISGRIRYYVVQFIETAGTDSRILEKIWIDRTNMQVTRKQMFGGDGQVETDVQYSGYTTMGGLVIPQVITIERPVEDYNLQLTFQPATLKTNEKLAADAFQLERPAGAELVQADNPGPRP
jgi:outer membrane lipoprotein-sorting protein